MKLAPLKLVPALLIASAAGFGGSAHASGVLTTPAGGVCRQQFSSDAANLRFDTFGNVSNQANQIVPVVCSLPKTTGASGIRVWVDGTSLTNTHVSCGAAVYSFSTGLPRAVHSFELPLTGGRFDRSVDFTSSETGNFDYLTVTCSLPAFGSLQGFGVQEI
jgi:hypothetical protein